MAKLKEYKFDDDGMYNVAEGVIRQTKCDYVKGAKYLYGIYGYIPQSENEAIENGVKYKRATSNSPNRLKVRYLFDARRFVEKDPYEMFATLDKNGVFRDWDTEAIFLHYLEIYREMAEKIYREFGEFAISEDKLSEFLGSSMGKFKKAKREVAKYFESQKKTFEEGIFDFHERIEQKIKRERRRKKNAGV